MIWSSGSVVIDHLSVWIEHACYALHLFSTRNHQHRYIYDDELMSSLLLKKKRWLKISGAACISDSSIDMPGNIPPMPLSWMWPDCRGRSKDSPLTSSLIEGISNSPCVATTPFLLHLCFPVAPRHTQDKDLHTCRALDAYSVFPWGDNEMIDYMMYSEF